MKINLFFVVHDELQKLQHVTMNEFKRCRQVMSNPMEITETVKINGDEHLAVLGCSSFASSPRNNKLFKEPIDVSQFVSIDMFKDKGFYYFKPRILSLLNK